MLTNVKAVLFDLDGTLVDSMWMWKDIDIEYLAKRGYELPPELQTEIEGMSFTETAIYFKKIFQLPEDIDTIQREWVEMAKDKYAHQVPFKPGAKEFLAYLKEQKIRTGIATSNSRELLDAVLESLQLNRYLDYTITACEAGAGKPAPDAYLKVAEVLKVKPEECLVFEDTVAGIQAGLNAGIRVCAMEDDFSAERKDLIFQLANYYITDYHQVLNGTHQSL